MLITAARGFGRRFPSLLFRSMLLGQQRRVRKVGTRVPWWSVGDIARGIERVEDRTLLSSVGISKSIERASLDPASIPTLAQLAGRGSSIGVSQADVDRVFQTLTTTGSATEFAYLHRNGGGEGDYDINTSQSTSQINLDDFRNDARFAGVDGNGFGTVIIDTGIDLNHPFFGPDVAPADGIADRIAFSFDFTGANDSDASDFNGHGSNVSSIVGSSDATHTGMAPGVDIIHLKVFPDAGGSASTADIEEALQWVVANTAAFNIASVNLSLGSGNVQTLVGGALYDEFAALAALSVIPAVSSGNEFFTVGSVQGMNNIAARPHAIAVGAVYDANIGGFSYGSGAIANTTAVDRITPFTQRHSQLLHILAPGAAITGANATGGTVTQHGTSQASPHISGIAVLAQQVAVQELGRRLTVDEFRDLLQSSGAILNDGDDEDDNVTNTNLNFSRVDVFALGEAILELEGGSLSGTVFNDQNGDGSNAGDPGLTGWTVYMDSNNNSSIDTGSSTHVSTNVPVSIAATGIPAVQSTNTVTGVPGVITDLNVTLNISHTWNEDLAVFLTAPDGTVVQLFSGLGGSSDNFTNTSLDDEAGSSITTGSAPFTGTFRPQGLLSAFDGRNANGVWVLDVGDTFNGDGGAINSWSMNVSYAERSQLTIADGSYTFTDVPIGSHIVRQVSQAGYTQTAPPGGFFNLNVTTGQNVTGLNFGNQDESAASDLGDAPSAAQSGFASSYPVTMTENGARHTATGPRLGSNRDAEADGSHSASADADDVTGSPDDEDGVTISGTIIASKLAASTGSITVNLQNADGTSNRLDAWIDFNRDGDWADAGEQIFANFNLGTSNGAQVLNFTIPQDTGANIEQGTSYARFRVSTAGSLGVTGAASDGEVEDYLVTLASSAAFIVDTLTDESDGNFAAGDFSLREAIELANVHTGLDEIQFAPGLAGGTITLTVGQLLVNDDLTLTGLGAANLTISGGNSFRVLDLQTNPDVIISGLTITGGRTTVNGQGGGGIRSTGTLQLNNSIVTSNTTTGAVAEGGGIFQIGGSLSITNSTVSGNSTTGSGSYGGGISSVNGDVTIVTSTISGNSTASSSGVGGGVIVRGTSTDLQIVDSTISNNQNTGAGSVGGGVAMAVGNLSIVRSTISGNTTTADAGGVGFDSNGTSATALIVNSTISGNTATAGIGGGIANYRGTLELKHSTVTGNTAPAGSGSGLASRSDGTLIANTIVLSSIISANTNSDVDNILSGTGSNTITSSGFNLVGNGNATGSFGLGSDQTGVTNPLLGALANNGGPTLTHALLAGSAAIGNGDTVSAEATDQRGAGFARIVGSRADIGAFELQATNPSVTLSVNNPWFAEASGTATFTATLSQISALDVTVNLGFTGTATGSGTDYNASGTQIVIAAGTLTGSVTVTAVQDGLVDESETVVADISSVVNGTELSPQQETSTILDDDVATLTVTIAAGAVSEGAGAAATTATVTRNTSTALAMTVNLNSSDISEATVPASVIIPAGQSSVTFNINAVDDVILDGTQTVTITATEAVASTMMPDSTFGTSGIVTTDLRNGIQYGDPEMILQPDGKILTIGRHPTLDDSWQIVRLNSNGSFDSTFGNNGIVITAFAGETTVRPTGIAVHPITGKITVAGMNFAGSSLMVARYNSDGTLDNSFGSGGKILSSPPGLSVAVDVVLNSDGSTFLTGTGDPSGVAVVKLLANGTLDSSFGVGGIASHALDPNYVIGIGDVAQQADGKIVITAGGFPSTGNERFYVVRINLDGSLDNTFDGDGFTLIDFGVLRQRPEAVKIQADGAIVVAGRVEPTSSNNSDWAVVRLNPNGSLDTTFSGDGKVTVGFASEDLVHDLALLSDGKIMLVGGAFVSGNGRDRGFARLNTDGTLDNSFGTGGKFTLPPLPVVWEENWDVAVQPDGKIVTLAGYLTNYQIERFQSVTGITGTDILGVTDNDVQSLIVSSTEVSVTEGATNTFTVRLAFQPAANVTVSVARISGDTDLTVSGGGSLTFTTANWNTPQTVTLAAAEDVDLTNGSAVFDVTSTGLSTVSVTGTEADNDAQSLMVSSTSVSVTEGATNTFTVRLAFQPAASVTVSVARISGDTDLTVSGGGSLTFTTANWNTPQTVTLAAAEDVDLANGSAVFDVTSTGLSSISVTGTEADNDVQSLIVSSTAVSVTEGASNTFTVRLAFQPAANVTVAVARVSGDTDLTVSGGGSLTFTTANWNTPQTVTLAAAEDVDLTNGSAVFDVTSTGLSTVSVTGTEADNDVQSLMVSSTSVSVTEGASNTFTVRLAFQPAANVTVAVARVSGDTDLTVSGGGSLTFTTANWNTPQTVTLAAAEDADLANGSAVFDVTSTGLSTISVTGTEADNDVQSLIVSSTAVSVTEGATNTFTVRLAFQPAASVTVSVARVSGDTDLTVSGGGSLTFTTANWNTPQTVTLAAAEDVDLANSSAVFDVTSTGLSTVSVTGTEADNDVQSLIVSSTAVSVTEGATNTFTVRLAFQPAASVTVAVARVSGDTDLTVSGGGSLTFTTANWNTPQTVTLAAAEDVDLANGSAVFDVTSTGLATVSVTGTEADNDVQSLMVSSTEVSVAEGATNTFTVRLAFQPAADVTVSVARISGDTDLTVGGGGSLTFTTANWNTPQTVTLAAAEDADLANDSAVFDVTSTGLSTVSVTGTEADNDTAVNQAPTDVTLTPMSASLAENASTAGAITVATIAVTDDGLGTNVLSLSGADAASFEIVGNELRLKAGVSLDYETKSSYSVTVDVDDATVGGSPDASATFTLTLTNVTELNGIDVQKGQSQRSFVRYLDILFDQGGSDLLDLISNNRLQLTRFDLNGENGVAMALPTPSVSGSQIQLDFGAQGITGNRGTNTGDGYYRIGVDMDGNGSFETMKYFHRLLGDVTGNGIVDSADKEQVLASQGMTYSAESDVNGDGLVSFTDASLVSRAVRRKLKDDLFRDD
jgi:uncharacterized delta-60 repeat protein